MKETRLPRQEPGFERSLNGLADNAKRVEHTFGRFNLAYDKTKAEDFVVHESDGSHSRYLITEFDSTTEKLTKALSRENIEHLPVSKIEKGKCVFMVPSNAKLLLEENLYPDKESDETYISDQELFGKVGRLWGNIYAATGCLPEDTVLSSTGMREFSSEPEMVFPVPPFDNCQAIDDPADAAYAFDYSIRKELCDRYPDASAELIDGMIYSAGTAFREE